jgi:hypothetical protein
MYLTGALVFHIENLRVQVRGAGIANHVAKQSKQENIAKNNINAFFAFSKRSTGLYHTNQLS